MGDTVTNAQHDAQRTAQQKTQQEVPAKALRKAQPGQGTAGQLVPVLEGFPPPPMPVSVLYPQSRHLSSRLRVFIDWLAEVFRARQT